MKNINKEATKILLLFDLFYQKKKVSHLEIDAEECTLYDISEDAVLNSFVGNIKDKKLNIQLTKDAGKWELVANKTVLVNGVAWRKRILKEGDRIYLGAYRLIYVGSIEKKPSVPVLPASEQKRKRLLRLFEAAAVVLSVSLLWFCTTVSNRPESLSPETDITIIEHETELPDDFTEELDDQEYVPLTRTDKDDISPLITYGPDDKPQPQKLDILFIHAHPDDESLDYGLYMSEAADNGMAIGLIILTDGDSGFDKYPDRPVDGFYKDSYLSGQSLAEVRVQEAGNALSVLGANIYIRMGLWNRPYTSEEVSKSVDTLIYEWGGEELLVDTLVNYMELFKPDIIVSPDGISNAREHFEHEASGYLSNLAVNLYKKRNPEVLKAYLKLVDVQQTEAYEGISLLYIDAANEAKYLEQKRMALMMHQTQADASYYGIKRLEKFPVEYYKLEYSMESDDKLTLALLNKNMEKTLSGISF
jgi:LmbE family N-acetylglucosaminyl deacetylase